MTDSNPLPNFPSFPVVVDAKRREASPGGMLYLIFRVLLYCTYFFERFHFPQSRRCAATKSITLYTSCIPTHTPTSSAASHIDVERLFSPLDDEQFQQLQRVSDRLSEDGQDNVVAIWETLLASTKRKS